MIVVRLCPGSHLNFFEVVFLQKLRLTAPLVVRSSRPGLYILWFSLVFFIHIPNYHIIYFLSQLLYG
jgi:hypothetical protein